MNPNTNLRIKALRTIMEKEGIAAFIIPSTDPHLSEYVAPHWESRKWISGFTGSAGTVVITHHEAGLWTDSRYFLQAAQQLEGTEIVLYKEMLPETPSILAFLAAHLKAEETVGIDGKMFSATQVGLLEKNWPKQIFLSKPLPIPWRNCGQIVHPSQTPQLLSTTSVMQEKAAKRNRDYP